MHFTPELRLLVFPLYLHDDGSSRYANYIVGKALFIAFERVFDRPKRARNHYAMLKCSFGYLIISPLFWAIRFGWRTHIGCYSLDTLLLSTGSNGITLLLCAELSLDTLLLSAGLKGITLLLCAELSLDTLLLSAGLKGITLLLCVELSLDTLLLSTGLKGITLLLCMELSLDTLLLSAGLKGITLLLCVELSFDTLLLSTGLKGITLLLCMELSLDTLLLSAGLKGITLLLCTELSLDTLLLSVGLKGITLLLCVELSLVFAGSVLWTEKIHRTELNRTMVRSIFRLWLPKFGVVLVAGCLISKIIQNRSKTG